MRVAFGLKARTGRAALVAVAGDVREPQLIERSQIQLPPLWSRSSAPSAAA